MKSNRGFTQHLVSEIIRRRRIYAKHSELSAGFTALEGLLILVIVGILGGTGWYVWNAHNKANDTLTNADAANSSVAKYSKKLASQKKDETASWLQYESPDKKITMKIPDGWKLTEMNSTGLFHVDDNGFAISSGTKAVITKATGGRGYSTGLAILFDQSLTKDYCGKMLRGVKQDSLKTLSNIEIVKYKYAQTEKDLPDDVPYGGTAFNYCVTQSGYSIYVNYGIGPSDTDYSQNLEKALKTVTFNS